MLWKTEKKLIQTMNSFSASLASTKDLDARTKELKALISDGREQEKAEVDNDVAQKLEQLKRWATKQFLDQDDHKEFRKERISAHHKHQALLEGLETVGNENRETSQLLKANMVKRTQDLASQ